VNIVNTMDIEVTCFASNTGSCESFAHQLAGEAQARGLLATVQTLDSAVGSLPKSTPVVIICPSYEGEPADNGRQFLSWILSQGGDAMADVTYAVFGAGHEDWVETYQRVPKLIDAKMAELGGSRILARGVGNAAGDFFGAFEEWKGDFLRAAGCGAPMATHAPPASAGTEETAEPRPPATGLRVEIIDERRATKLGHKNFGMGVVTENRALTADKMTCGSLPKRHIEMRLPEGLKYRAGKYDHGHLPRPRDAPNLFSAAQATTWRSCPSTRCGTSDGR
jgi:cytochrome P450 / NADPH-cytochrome P450 reductase